MALVEELNKQGNKLFRYRSKLPIPFAIIGMMVHTYDIIYQNKAVYSFNFELFCLSVGLVGLIIRSITLAYTPRGTSGRNTDGQVADELNTKGMYSLMRNPLYLGNFFMWFAIILYINNHWFSLVYILSFWIYYERIIFAEENFLRKKYGDTYINWTMNTPIFLPRLRGWVKPDLEFSIKNILKREYSGFFALFFTLSLFNLAENFVRTNTWVLSDFWLKALVISGFITLILKLLKKNTTVLNVKGR